MFMRLFYLLPAVALTALAAFGTPLPVAAQADATATPPATVAMSATVAVSPTVTPTVTATVTPTATTPATTPAAPTATLTSTATLTPTAMPTATVPTATATLTATATPTATVPATATVPVAGADAAGPWTATVRTSADTRLRVRSGPGPTYPIVSRLNNGQAVTLLGRNATGSWLLVALPGQNSPYGWASASYLTTKAPVAQLPVSSALPAPAASAAGTAPAPSSGVPSPGSLAGKIAVPVFDADQGIYNIWLVQADGTDLRLVVANASAPALSADGTLLAYRHWQRDDRGLVVANSDGSNAWRVTDKLEDVLPSFSPDKTKLVFSTYRQGDRRSRLYYVWTDEQNRRAWEWGAGGLFGEDPDWMADGQIAYHTSGEQAQLWLMNGDATNQRPFFATGSITAIAASPDSQAVAYMGDSGGNWDIYRVGVDGENARRLTDDPARDGLPAWSPDGQSIAFVSDRSGQWALWVMDSDGDNQRLLALLPGPVDGFVQFEPDYLNHGWLEEQIAWSR